jgi:hypothetical protein
MIQFKKQHDIKLEKKKRPHLSQMARSSVRIQCQRSSRDEKPLIENLFRPMFGIKLIFETSGVASMFFPADSDAANLVGWKFITKSRFIKAVKTFQRT